MKIARISLSQGPRFAVIDSATQKYHVLAGDPLYSGFEVNGQVLDPGEVNLVAPMLPRSKVVGFTAPFSTPHSALVKEALAGQSMDYWVEQIAQLGLYMKPNTAVLGGNTAISLPDFPYKIVAEPHLAAIISRPVTQLLVQRVPEAVFAYTLATVVTVPDLAGVSPLLAYGLDTSCVLGPVMDTEFPAGDFDFGFQVGAQECDCTLVLDPIQMQERIALAASYSTLLPGDIVLSGAICEPKEIKTGDEVIFTAKVFGELRSPVLN